VVDSMAKDEADEIVSDILEGLREPNPAQPRKMRVVRHIAGPAAPLLTGCGLSRNLREERETAGMVTKHNITVAIEPGLLKKARAIAARRGLSVSALLADELRELVADDARYAAAQKRAAALFSTPLPLGGVPLSREELHERRRLR
jgi:hypothetical protein